MQTKPKKPKLPKMPSSGFGKKAFGKMSSLSSKKPKKTPY